MTDVVFQICDCCGRYCVKRLETGRLEAEPTTRVMIEGIVMHVCESCEAHPMALRKLLDKRKLIAEQNAALDDPLGVRAPKDAGCG